MPGIRRLYERHGRATTGPTRNQRAPRRLLPPAGRDADRLEPVVYLHPAGAGSGGAVPDPSLPLGAPLGGPVRGQRRASRASAGRLREHPKAQRMRPAPTAQIIRPVPFQYRSLRTRFTSLPVGVRGSSSAKSIVTGHFILARCWWQNAMSSCSSSGPAWAMSAG